MADDRLQKLSQYVQQKPRQLGKLRINIPMECSYGTERVTKVVAKMGAVRVEELCSIQPSQSLEIQKRRENRGAFDSGIVSPFQFYRSHLELSSFQPLQKSVSEAHQNFPSFFLSAVPRLIFFL